MDANVSIRPAGEATLGTKTELKNMNSFRFLERGIEAEIERQEGIVRDGGEVEQETLHFDPRVGRAHSLRSKEEAHDYRYFPEPDLVPLAPTERDARARPRGAARAAAGARRAARARLGAARRPGAAVRLPRRARRLLRGGARPPTAADARDARQLGRERAGRAARRRATRPRRSSSPRRSRGWWRWWRRARSPRPRAKEVLDVLVGGGRRPGRDRGGAGPGEAGERRARARSSTGRWPSNADAVEKIRAGKRQGDRRDRRRGDAGDEGPRRRRRGPAA